MASSKETISFAKVLHQAALHHSGAIKHAKRISSLLTRCEKAGIRRPDEWVFEWTGTPTFRWHDGKGDYHAHKATVTVTLRGGYDKIPATYAIGGGLDRTVRYSSESRTDIPGLSEDGVLAILPVLLGLLDQPSPSP